VTGPAAATRAVSLEDVFRVEPARDGTFTAEVPEADMGGRPFGGHLIGLAVRAAARTVADHVAPVPHAVHARFVRAGRTGEPVEIQVERVHDGRTIAVRRLTVVQESRTLLTGELSFAAADAAERWQAERPAAHLPGNAVFSPLVGAPTLAPFEVRAEHEHVRGAPARLHPFWARTREAVPVDDPVLHACGLAILTDVGVTASARRPGSPMRVQRAAVTLDHALWLHGPFHLDEWLQVAVTPVVNSGGRGLARGEVSREDGTLVASFVQEVLLRLPGAPT
jgi:acyl-CoA thioesterase-2